MQSNVFSGHIADTPTLRGNGDNAVCRLTLISNEYAGRDDDGTSRERQVAVQFVAFRRKAEAIARNCRKGDQLFVRWDLRNNNWEKDGGEKVYGYDFVIDDFDFGAPGSIKRAELAERRGND